jgi:hypothetical protein
MVRNFGGIRPRGTFLVENLLAFPNSQSLINQDPDQPTAKGAIVFETRRIPRRTQPTVFDSIVCSFRTAKNATGNQVQQSVAPPESGTKWREIPVEPVCGQ